MKTSEIIIFYSGFLVALAFCFRNLLLGNPNDNFFSEKTRKKLVVPKDSVLRKIVRFKETKHSLTPLLYIRVIPYLIVLSLLVVGTILLVINLLVGNFIPGEIFQYSGLVMWVIYIAYELILIILARVFKI